MISAEQPVLYYLTGIPRLSTGARATVMLDLLFVTDFFGLRSALLGLIKFLQHGHHFRTIPFVESGHSTQQSAIWRYHECFRIDAQTQLLGHYPPFVVKIGKCNFVLN